MTFDRLILEKDYSKEDKALKYFFSALKDGSVDIFNNHYVLFLPPKPFQGLNDRMSQKLPSLPSPDGMFWV